MAGMPPIHSNSVGTDFIVSLTSAALELPDADDAAGRIAQPRHQHVPFAPGRRDYLAAVRWSERNGVGDALDGEVRHHARLARAPVDPTADEVGGLVGEAVIALRALFDLPAKHGPVELGRAARVAGRKLQVSQAFVHPRTSARACTRRNAHRVRIGSNRIESGVS